MVNQYLSARHLRVKLYNAYRNSEALHDPFSCIHESPGGQKIYEWCARGNA